MNPNICNNCGGDYEYQNGKWICRACGSYKPEALSNEEITLLYIASQKLRMADFDEAEREFDDMILKYPRNANAYWGRMMARYGIRYEQDTDGRRIPTCYAASIESVMGDSDYRNALKYADKESKAFYVRQAEYMERVRLEWIEKAKKEKPYDIFLCYKDSDPAAGIERTEDSVAAQELYIHLTRQGYRVFFSRESLRDKVGEKYEPYIFNALSTAKVMLVYGSSAAYVNSTWLRNEWTRYEKRIAAGEKSPNSLLVACDGFSPNELPKTLAFRQCFDATKRSFYSDLDETVARLVCGGKKEKKAEAPAPLPKKRRKTAIFCILLAIAAGLFALNLLNRGPGSANGLEYTENGDGTWSVSGMGTCRETDIVIPATHNGGSVTVIADFAFEDQWRLKSAVIPDTVKKIGASAFKGCFMENISIPDSVVEIGESAFHGCYDLKSVVIPASVTKIGKSAFYGCNKLGSVVIQGNVTRLEDAVFQWCSALTSVTVPQSVTEIGEYAFSGCTALTSLSLPSRLKSLGSMAFDGCTALTSVVIPDSVTEMGSMAFYGCSGLRAITISAGLTKIDADMFDGCANLSEITVAKGNPVYHSAGNCLIETRAKALVLGCQASVIPTDGSVTRIGDSAFEGCSELKSLLIPDAVEKIDMWAFGDCPGLLQITVEAGHPVYHSAGNCLIETQSKTLVLGCQTSVIPTDGSVTSIAHSAFRGCSTLTSIVIPNGVERIGGSAFDYCSGLASVIISSDLTEIGSHAFNECSNLTSIVFNGTRAEWNAVIKGEGWNYRIPAAGVLCSDGMAYFE